MRALCLKGRGACSTGLARLDCLDRDGEALADCLDEGAVGNSAARAGRVRGYPCSGLVRNLPEDCDAYSAVANGRAGG